MFNCIIDNSFSFCLFNDSDEKIPVSDWAKYNDKYLAQLSILNELVENGFAEHTQNSCLVESIEILKLTEIDKKILGLPDPYPYEIYVQSNGQLNQSSFKFKFGFYDFTPNGNLLRVQRNGPIIKVNDRNYLLSANQFLICEALKNFNLLPEAERTFQNNLKRFADIKTLSKEAATLLDNYLQNENVYQPEKIKVDLEFQNNFLEIIPNLNIDNQAEFLKTFDTYPSVKDVYPVRNKEGGVTRIIIDEKQKQELQTIKKNRKIYDKKAINALAEHPEEFFNEETIDYSVFYSERVKEIGIYKPKFYPFVCPYKSEWIPGIEIKDHVLGRKKIFFKTTAELDQFESEKTRAVIDNKDAFEWKGSPIPVKEAEDFIDIARKQFKNTRKPIKTENLTNGEVLIIKENAELLEYSEHKTPPDEIHHTFYQIPNLQPFINLKDHQKEGIAWLQNLYKQDVNGCLLADDMGLGKTLQLLYFIEWHAQTNHSEKPYLIVAPVSLLENWENEYYKFFSSQSLLLKLLYGAVEISRQFDAQEVSRLQKRHIILTNYETLKTYQLNLCAIDYAVVVLDEAQKIKTPGTLVTNVSKALKADFKIAMTGTPVENTLVDFWSIMDFSVPGLLGNAKDFSKNYQHPLKKSDTDLKELGEKLRDQVGVFIKRRLKQDVLKDLPKKYDNTNSRIKQVMPLEQLEQYKLQIKQVKDSEAVGVEKGNQVLKSLWAIRDISDHPFLLNNQITNYSTEELVATSAKLQILIGILEDIRIKNEKAIVFADRRETQKMLQKVIYDYFEVFPSIVNGDTPTTKQNENKTILSRQQTIDRFQNENGFNVIVMSQLAAGVGLNVTKANHVIHYTRHWNPAKEQQATDRAYRIGQQMDVHVYYPMAVFPKEMTGENGKLLESFDEVLDKLLALKTNLATTTLFPTEQAEIKTDEIFSSVFSFDSDVVLSNLSINDIDNLNPSLFEAYIALLYKKQGFDVSLTPNQNNKGVNVIAIRNDGHLLLQSRQTKSLVNEEAIQEIYAAKQYYEQKLDKEFKLVIISNSNYTLPAETLARINQVTLIKRLQLEKLITENPVTIADVNYQESQRLKNFR